MKPSDRRLLSLLASSSPKGLSIGEILSSLRLKRKGKTQVRKIVGRLLRKGICGKSNGKYFVSRTKTARYPDGSRTPHGKILPTFEEEIDEARQIDRILKSNGILRRFDRSVLREVKNVPVVVLRTKSENRTDLRSLPFVTIDDREARDFDDAIYAERDPQGYRIWVSVADVAHYVKARSAIDRAAFARGVSTYLPERTLPMLPEELSSGICSLIAGRDRKTVTCEIVLGFDGRAVRFNAYRSINRIAARLNYEEADDMLETGLAKGGRPADKIAELLSLANEIAGKLEKKRTMRGMIDFALPEKRCRLDQAGRVVDFVKIRPTGTRKAIEHFMLEANENIGRFCHKNRIPILWRNHKAPMPQKKSEAKTLLRNLNLRPNALNCGRDFNDILSQMRQAEVSDIAAIHLLRVMSLAKYEIAPSFHFGLSVSKYCHFTSPIRRYPDLIVHRAVTRFLESKSSAKLSPRIAHHCSERERSATKAERKVVSLKQALFLSDRIGDAFDATVSGLHANGAFVTIERPFVEGFVPYRSILDDSYEVSATGLHLLGRRSKRRVSIGAQMRVKLRRSNALHLSPEFDWTAWK